MKEKHNVVMLPTNEATGIGTDRRSPSYPKLLLYHNPNWQDNKAIQEGYAQNYHIYITSPTAEIKEGDWYISFWLNGEPSEVRKADYKVTNEWALKPNSDFCKKVVATTDPKLHYICNHCGASKKNHSGLCEACGKFGTSRYGEGLFKPVPAISSDFIQAYIKAYNEGKPITEVLLEVDRYMPFDGKVAYEISFNSEENTRVVPRTRPSDNTVIIHPVKERMFTLEDMEKAWNHSSYSYGEWISKPRNKPSFKDWIAKEYPE